MLGLGLLFKVLLLVVNAMAILHEERFLRKGSFHTIVYLRFSFSFLLYVCSVYLTCWWLCFRDAFVRGVRGGW